MNSTSDCIQILRSDTSEMLHLKSVVYFIIAIVYIYDIYLKDFQWCKINYMLFMQRFVTSEVCITYPGTVHNISFELITVCSLDVPWRSQDFLSWGVWI